MRGWRGESGAVGGFESCISGRREEWRWDRCRSQRLEARFGRVEIEQGRNLRQHVRRGARVHAANNTGAPGEGWQLGGQLGAGLLATAVVASVAVAVTAPPGGDPTPAEPDAVVAFARTGETRKAGKELAQLAHANVYGLSFSPDGGTLATAGWDKKVRLWDVDRAKVERLAPTLRTVAAGDGTAGASPALVVRPRNPSAAVRR